MRRLGAAIAFAAFVAGAASAPAQVYPSRPITVVVPFAAGGPNDIVARIIAEPMRGSLGQPVIIENVAGANGTIGVGRVARAMPDGYTLSIGSFNSHVVNGAVYSLSYDVLRDFDPVALISSSASLIVARSSLPANDLAGLIAWLKANPDKALAGTPGVGSSNHVYCIFFQRLTGTRFQLVPYRGGGPSMQDLVAGQIDIGIETPITALPQARAGRIKAFAITAKNRLATAPDIPTVDEAGLPGFYTASWYGMWVPKGAPKDVIGRLSAAVMDALADPTVRRRLAELGHEVMPREQQSPEALGAHHKAEIEKWWPIIKAANIKVE
jgi:tripartite-type tricarboxylate transporter receptor subunit TctC